MIDMWRVFLGKVNNEPDFGGNIFQGIFVFVLFILIMLGAYYASRMIGKFQMNRHKNANLKIIEAIQVGPGKSVQLLQTGDECVLIGVSKDNITFIKSIDKESINFENIAQKNFTSTSFKEQFQKALSKKHNKDK